MEYTIKVENCKNGLIITSLDGNKTVCTTYDQVVRAILNITGEVQ